MRRAHVDPPPRACIYPAARNATAREHQSVWLIFVHDGEFKRAVVIGCHIKQDAASEQRGALMQINEPRRQLTILSYLPDRSCTMIGITDRIGAWAPGAAMSAD